MFSNLGSGLVNNLADNVLNPAVSRITGDRRAGEIGADVFKDKVPGLLGLQPQPGYQLPIPQQQQQGPAEYYQQMRESMEGMDKALKELEGMQMPGQQYQGGGGGNFAGRKTGKGMSLF